MRTPLVAPALPSDKPVRLPSPGTTGYALAPMALSPELNVALELGRALGGAALFPARILDTAFTRDALRAELLGDLLAGGTARA